MPYHYVIGVLSCIAMFEFLALGPLTSFSLFCVVFWDIRGRQFVMRCQLCVKFSPVLTPFFRLV